MIPHVQAGFTHDPAWDDEILLIPDLCDVDQMGRPRRDLNNHVRKSGLEELHGCDNVSYLVFLGVGHSMQHARCHTDMPHHELEPCGRCRSSTIARIVFV